MHHHTKLLQCYWLYIPYAVLYTPMTSLFCKWKFVALNGLYLTGGCRKTVFPYTSLFPERHGTLSLTPTCIWGRAANSVTISLQSGVGSSATGYLPRNCVEVWGPFSFSAIISGCKTRTQTAGTFGFSCHNYLCK